MDGLLGRAQAFALPTNSQWIYAEDFRKRMISKEKMVGPE
jgi:hypothetical protein